MKPQDLQTLRILEEIGRNESTSQRELAKKLDVSLGLVNAFIKRLYRKGYFKITTIPRNRVEYLLTPKGFAEKTRLTYQYIQYSVHFYKNIRGILTSLYRNLEQDGVKSIALYGCGEVAELAYLLVQNHQLKLAAVMDDTDKKNFFGYKVQDIRGAENIEKIEFDRILLTKLEDMEQNMRSLITLGIPEYKIIKL